MHVPHVWLSGASVRIGTRGRVRRKDVAGGVGGGEGGDEGDEMVPSKIRCVLMRRRGRWRDLWEALAVRGLRKGVLVVVTAVVVGREVGFRRGRRRRRRRRRRAMLIFWWGCGAVIEEERFGG